MDYSLAKTILFLLTGGFLVFLAITVTRDNFASRVNRFAGAMLFFAGLGPVFMGLGSLMLRGTADAGLLESTGTYQLYHVWSLFFPSLLVFSWLYPTDRLREFRHPWLRHLVFVPQIIHVVIAMFFGDISAMLADLEATTTQSTIIGVILKPFQYILSVILVSVGYVRTYDTTVFGVINLLYAGIAYYFLEAGQRDLQNPRLRTQAGVVLWSARVSLGLYAVYALALMLAAPRLPEGLATALLVVAALSGGVVFTVAIIRHQFLDVRLVFRQSLIYSLASAILVGLYIVVVLQSRRFLTPLFGEQAEIVSYLFIVFVLLMFQPISNWIDNVIRSMFMRTRTDYRTIIERFSRQIISMFDPRQLRQTIDETLKTAMLVECVYFVLYDDREEEYVLLAGDANPVSRTIRRNDLMLRGINLLDSPTPYDSLADYEEDSELAETLKELRVRLILPMKDAEHLLGFLALTSKVAGYRYTAEDYNLLGVLSNQAVSALTNARLYVESLERMRLQEEVNMARQIQLNLLPSSPPSLPRFAICALSTPSRTVGGDFYDFLPQPEHHRCGIVIADASGKGMPAALLIAQIQAIIHSEVNNGNSISTMLTNMNQQVVQSTSPEAYVTLFYGELDTQTNVFHYANAGHNHPVIVRSDGSCEPLDVGGPIIGALPLMQYTSARVQLNPSDVIFFFTDGLSEAMDDDGHEYGEDRIREFVKNQRDQQPDRIMQAILDDVHQYDPTSPPRDDTTVIAVKMITPEAAIRE